MYLLDTNVISELRRGKPHGAVLAWLDAISDGDLYLSAATIGELQAGAENTRDRDIERAAQFDDWIDTLSRSYTILPMDSDVFRMWARLMHGRTAALYEDAMIAATAIVHDLTVVTRNVRDFRNFDVRIVNPFETARR